MFWKFLLIWMLIGVITEVATWLLIGMYAAWMEDKSCIKLIKDREYDAFDDHTKWAVWLYLVFPRFIAGIIDVCLRATVWPLEVTLSIIHFKRFIDEQLPRDVNKAS
jgi:hypothetical protein